MKRLISLYSVVYLYCWLQVFEAIVLKRIVYLHKNTKHKAQTIRLFINDFTKILERNL